MKNILIIFVVMFSLISNLAFAGPKGKNVKKENSGVFFENLKDGQQVTSPVHVKMGITGKKVGPAGEVIEGVGHHHIIIDGTFVKKGDIVPADDKHLHFGKGQLETDVTLTPGKHTLTLQLADGAHRSYGKPWSKTIAVEVK